MAPSALSKKLQIKPGAHVLVLHAPDGYLAELGELPERAELAHRAKGHFDVVHVFVETQADVAKRADVAVKSLKPGGVLWFSWPKQTAKVPTDLNRDILYELGQASGLQAVASVSINETWSALRFKPQ